MGNEQVLLLYVLILKVTHFQTIPQLTSDYFSAKQLMMVKVLQILEISTISFAY